AVAVNPATNLVYVVNHGNDSVTVIDSAKLKVVATVKVGSQPQGIAVDAKSNRIYVANVHGDSVSVIDGQRNRVAGALPVGKNPFALAVNQDSGKVYVAHESGVVAVIDGSALSLREVGREGRNLGSDLRGAAKRWIAVAGECDVSGFVGRDHLSN